jgi:hypothetical protein
MEVISSGHMNVEKKILDPHGWVCCPIVRFYVDGFKPLGELVLHHLVSETHGVCGAPGSGHVTPEIGCHPGAVLLLSSAILIAPGLVSIPSSGRVHCGSVNGS